MIKLNAGFSRKVGEANYGSRGASVNVELELESGLISDPDGLMGRIRGLFEIARQSVDAELANGSADANADAGPARNNGGNGHRSGGRDGNGQQGARYATNSQIRAIKAICDRQGVDALGFAGERFNVGDLQQLTLRQASTLIDELKGESATGRTGGSR